MEERCYLCNANKKNTEYSNIINVIIDNNLNDSIENLIIKNFEVTICPKYAYNKKGIIGVHLSHMLKCSKILFIQNL